MNKEFIVGNTPLMNYTYDGYQFFVKHESSNPFGSMKDRAATHIISSVLAQHIIDNTTTIVESSSGNFGVALAAVCKRYGLHFICVIDSNTNPMIEKLLTVYGVEILKVVKSDAYGGYLINRLKKVEEILSKNENCYWTNQYENPLNAESYHSLADEILSEVSNPDYVFVPVSSGGTITGISNRIKEKSPHTKIIAVDSKGSVVFGGQAAKRHLPGMGSSIVPPILKNAQIDNVLLISEIDMIRECRNFFNQTGMLIGGSSGACLFAIKKYFRSYNQVLTDIKIVTIFADKGERYIDTIYDDLWCKEHFDF